MRILFTRDAWRFWLFVGFLVAMGILQIVVDYDG